MPKPQVRTPQEKGVAGEPAARPWLLLTHQIPPEPSYFRVKVRRQLERIGAVPLKNSVYVLPPGDDTREDFEWLSREIERNGGETTLCLASFLDDATDDRILAAFRDARRDDYASIERAARERIERREEDLMNDQPAAPRSVVARLRRRLTAVSAIDFFDAPGRDEAERAVDELESLQSSAPSRQAAGAAPVTKPPTGATWVTRKGPKVDRMASAWLVRRFIDPAATFKFVPARGYKPAKGELRFDMFGGEFTHEGDRCTFETLMARFGLFDRALTALAEIVHDIDCKDEKFGRAEVSGVASMIDGITRVCDRDEERIERGAALFEGLYEHFSSGRT